MKKATQNNNFIKITTAFGYDSLILNNFYYYEGISELFSLQAQAYFNGTRGELAQVIGTPVIISMDYPDGLSEEPRYFHGIVTKARMLGSKAEAKDEAGGYKNIELTIQPKLALCAFRKNSRIFQNRNLEDIVSILLSEHSVDFGLELEKSYGTYNYKVQYNETDLEFILRLLSEEGVGFCFEHTKSQHKLVLFDEEGFYQPNLESAIKYTSVGAEKGHIASWYESQKVSPKSTCFSGFDVHRPASLPRHMTSNQAASFNPELSEYFEYLGEEATQDQYAFKSSCTLDSLQRDSRSFSGEASCRSFTVARSFKFENHEDKEMIGNEYVLTHVSINASILTQARLDNSARQGVDIQFSCIDVNKLYRPLLPIGKPKIHGIQTAIVTGPSEGDVYVDKMGRIKVKFHWDREGKQDEQSSCWIRVAQQSAGNGWGSVFHPRVGQEVIVEFINGDPDQPIVMGCLYNGQNSTPYTLPSDKSQSGIKTRSIKGQEANFNELRFDDKPGKERVYLHAEKDFQSVVENCATTLVEKDKTETVNNNQSQTVGKNLSVDIGEVMSLNAGKSIEFKAGGASITLSSSGEINIKGSKIAINGSAITLKAGNIALN